EFKRRARSSGSITGQNVTVVDGPLLEDGGFTIAQDSIIAPNVNQAGPGLLKPEPLLDRQQPRRSTSIR
ncbi:MAG: hypothetical protein KGQ60_18720, partial [Planctomycetes bacterium]|nr:hypothetical protein [Planctomycetota bacterium]